MWITISEGIYNMDEIVKYYQNSKTSKKHDIRVDKCDHEIILWYLFWGEYGGVDSHHHMGIARICSNKNGFKIGWLKGTELQVYKSEQVTDLKELFNKIDAEIANR